MNDSDQNPVLAKVRLFPVLAGALAFLAIQYAGALWTLTQSSGPMANKFSALARDKHLGFLIRENLLMLVAYGFLAIAAVVLAQPLVSFWTRRSTTKACARSTPN